MGNVVEEALAKRFPIYQSSNVELADEILLNTVGFDCGPEWVVGYDPERLIRISESGRYFW